MHNSQQIRACAVRDLSVISMLSGSLALVISVTWWQRQAVPGKLDHVVEAVKVVCMSLMSLSWCICIAYSLAKVVGLAWASIAGSFPVRKVQGCPE